jgi:hypothetical protein
VAGPGGDAPQNAAAWGWREVTIGAGENMRYEWRPEGRRVGWVDGQDLFLMPEGAHAEVQRFAGEQGESLPISARTMRKRLHERRLLASTGMCRGRQSFTIRRTLEGTRREVLHLLVTSLPPLRPDQPDQASKTPTKTGQVGGQVAGQETPNLTTDLTTKPDQNPPENGELVRSVRSDTGGESPTDAKQATHRRRGVV